MMEIDLIRVTLDRYKPQQGAMLFDGIQRLSTLELPDLDNSPNISCVPTGVYLCKRGEMYIGHESNRKLIETFLLQDVPNRSDIGIHPANYARELRGCIAVGYIPDFDGNGGLGDSKRAHQRFMELTQGVDQFTLHIRHA